MKTYLLFTFFFLSTALSAQIIYVDQDATGQNDGSSWTNAYTDLNEALDAAQYGDSVWVAEGTYFPTDDDNRHRHFTLRNGIKLIGGFAGTETSAAQRAWETYLTILDGDIGTPGDASDNSYTVVYVEVVDSTTWLDGFVIQHGYADGVDSAATTNGGGLFFLVSPEYESSPNFRNLIVRDNHAISRGGGGYTGSLGSGTQYFSPLFHQCQFINNTANSDGGGLKLFMAPFERPFRMESCSFIENAVTEQTLTGEAGGLYINFDSNKLADTGFFEIVNCYFENNDAGETTQGGGGMRFEDTGKGLHLKIKNCKFKGNVADEGAGSALAYKKFGNDVQTIEDEIHVTDCEFIENNGDNTTVELNGEENQNITVSNCYFARNNTMGHSAGLFVRGNVRIVNSIFIENGQTSSSLIVLTSTFSEYDSLIVDHCTFIANDHEYGLILFQEGNPNFPFGPMEVRNCVFRGNEELGWYGNIIGGFPGGATPLVDNCVLDVSVCFYPMDDELTCGPDLIFDDAVFIDSAGGDFRLHPCSPGIDMGAEGYWNTNLPTTDFLGAPRVVGAAADMGAFETPPPTVRIDSLEGLECPEDTLGSISLAVDYACGPYTLKWPDGLVTDTLFYSNLTTGIYSITVTDNLGRTDTVDLEVSAPSELMAEALITDSNQSGPGTGSILITSIIGGTPPYSGQWIGGPSGDLYADIPPGTYDYVVTDSLGCTAEFTFEVGAINSVADWGAVGRLQVFPNPFAHTLEVRLPAQADRYSVHDMQGRLMEVGDIQPGQQQLQLGAAWSPGLYVVQVVSGAGEIWRGRVVKSGT